MHLIPYLNRGQMLAIEQGEEAYRKAYIEGKGIPVNRGVALGRDVAEALEKDEETGNAMNDFVIAMLPKYDVRDKKIYIDMKIGKEIIPIRIQPDSMKSDMSAFYEYKTGGEHIPWNQRKVDADDQITFYATGIYIMTKKIPACELIWAPTRKVIGEDGISRPELTGETRRFVTIRRMSHILKMMGRMRKAWKLIGEVTDKEII